LTNVKRRLLTALRYLTAIVMILLLAAMIAGHVADARAHARAATTHPMLGKLVDVGGYRIHLYCTGAGKPTVILDSEFAGSTWEWDSVQRELSRSTRVCSFDRPGLGWSEASPLPRTSANIAKELHTALSNGGETAPYVVVGHSISGLDVRMFQSEFPSEVQGMALVDAVHPEWVAGSVTPGQLRIFGVVNALGPTGLLRFLGFCGKRPAAQGPPTCGQYVRANYQQVAAGAESAREVESTTGLGNMPLAVIARDSDAALKTLTKPEEIREEKDWVRWQHELAKLSSNTTFIVATGAGHEIPQEKPQVIVDAIREMVGKLRG
jgi:pimeloyl-ACP methyl ester carboxylesterase